ncbi:MAG: nitrate/sulfonate/bicarbonate ABC transporter ATP-binding protein [Anaerolineales bacterium]|nr:nitrate/sulfonate/bicarbonate ABC transporter ATP-binding protein [Anaerolineales bacterium]
MPATLLEVRGVHQIYGTGERRFTAVQDINLTLKEGEFVALVGPSGCGKSTLLRIITGLNKPSSGVVLYRDNVVDGVNPHATIVFQTFALFPWLTVQQNVEIALKVRGVAQKERAEKAVALLDKVGLDGFENAYPRELSGGMRQKVGFARAMAVEPELLCLDEPFSALDVLSAEALRGELLELWEAGDIPTKAILLVTHNIEEAISLADRVVVMAKEPGRIIADLTVDLPHPRQRKDADFIHKVDMVYAALAGQTQPEALEMGSEPGGAGRTRTLPDVQVTNLAGLLEALANKPDDRADIYQLVDELKIDSNHLFPLAEAAELLGFASIAKGDMTLTALGQTFADASILTRKEIFAARIRRLPMFRWLLNLLERADAHRLGWDVIQSALEFDFPPVEAEKQVEVAVHWGRYAELLTYDDDTALISLEEEAPVHA